jgi:hypothetical protein
VLELLAQLAEILDDAVVDHGQAIGGVRVRVAFGRPAVGCPTRVADADGAGERLAREPCFEIARSLPSARRRASCPASRVATPAES